MLWIDCGNGTFAALQEHIDLAELTGVVVTHTHPDHVVDIFGLDVAFRYGPFRQRVTVYAPTGSCAQLAGLAGASFGSAFDWVDLSGDAPSAEHHGLHLQFSRTQHPVPTYAVGASDVSGRTVAYTSDTGPGWDPRALGNRIDLLLAEATYLTGLTGAPIHLTAAQAAGMAATLDAKQLLLTHLWPGIDPADSMREAAPVFSKTMIAIEGMTLHC